MKHDFSNNLELSLDQLINSCGRRSAQILRSLDDPNLNDDEFLELQSEQADIDKIEELLREAASIWATRQVWDYD